MENRWIVLEMSTIYIVMSKLCIENDYNKKYLVLF